MNFDKLLNTLNTIAALVAIITPIIGVLIAILVPNWLIVQYSWTTSQKHWVSAGNWPKVDRNDVNGSCLQDGKNICGNLITNKQEFKELVASLPYQQREIIEFEEIKTVILDIDNDEGRLLRSYPGQKRRDGSETTATGVLLNNECFRFNKAAWNDSTLWLYGIKDPTCELPVTSTIVPSFVEHPS